VSVSLVPLLSVARIVMYVATIYNNNTSLPDVCVLNPVCHVTLTVLSLTTRVHPKYIPRKNVSNMEIRYFTSHYNICKLYFVTFISQMDEHLKGIIDSVLVRTWVRFNIACSKLIFSYYTSTSTGVYVNYRQSVVFTYLLYCHTSKHNYKFEGCNGRHDDNA
jgi:hypothetical protein